MAIATTITTAGKRRGGGVPAASFVVVAFLAGALLWFSQVALPGRDTVLPLLPGSVRSYVHGDADAAWLIDDARLAELRPQEFAIVGFPDKDGNRHLATFVRFSPFRRLPMEALEGIGATEFAPGIFVLADAYAATKITETNTARFTDYEEGVDALKALRGAFDVQMLEPSDSTRFPLLGDAPSVMVAGFSVHGDRFTGIAAEPSAVPRNVFGYRAEDGPQATAAALIPNAAALTLIPGDGTETDAAALTMSSIDAVRASSDTPRSPQLDAAAKDLDGLLHGASISLIDKGPDASPSTVTVLPPSVDDGALLDALSAYIAASIPDRRPISFPDGSWTTELTFTSDATLEAAGPKTHRLAARFRDYAGTDLFVTRTERGVVIASSADDLRAGTEAITTSARVCGIDRVGTPSLILNDAERFGGLEGRFDGLMRQTGATRLLITRTGAETVRICGYSYP